MTVKVRTGISRGAEVKSRKIGLCDKERTPLLVQEVMWMIDYFKGGEDENKISYGL